MTSNFMCKFPFPTTSDRIGLLRWVVFGYSGLHCDLYRYAPCLTSSSPKSQFGVSCRLFLFLFLSLSLSMQCLVVLSRLSAVFHHRLVFQST